MLTKSMILNTIANQSKDIIGVISLITAIGGCIIYVENNFAHAGDVQKILENQDRQLKQMDRSQRQNSLFQLEYYDDRIQKLGLELRKAEVGPRTRSIGQRSFEEIQSEINEVKQRREFVRKMLEEPTSTR